MFVIPVEVKLELSPELQVLVSDLHRERVYLLIAAVWFLMLLTVRCWRGKK